MARTLQRRKPMSQINVVPYIDVMLVLLIIFMVTAPLLQQGVEVDLPNAPSKPLPTAKEENNSLVVTVNNAGQFFLSFANEPDQQVDDQLLSDRVRDLLAQHTDAPVYVKGDEKVDYGRVMTAMVILQSSGARGIGLITDPASDETKH